MYQKDINFVADFLEENFSQVSKQRRELIVLFAFEW